MSARPAFLPAQRYVVLLGLVCAALSFAWGFVVAGDLSQRQMQAAHWVARTQEIRAELERVHVDLTEAETQHRNYLLLPHPRFLHAYRARADAVRAGIDRAHRMIASPVQQTRLRKLRHLAAATLAEYERIHRQPENERWGTARELLRTHDGRDLPDEVNAVLDQMLAEEDRLFIARQTSFRTWVLQSRRLTAALAASGLLLLAAMIYLFQRETNQRLRQQRREQQMLRELETERTFLRGVIDTSPALIIVKDAQSRFVLVNEATAKAYNTTPEALVGRTDADVNTHAEEVAVYHEADRRLLESGKEVIVPEEPITSASGETRWYLTTKRPLTVPTTGQTGILVICTDITDRKRAEENATRLQGMLEAILTNAPAAMWIKDTDRRYLMANAQAQAIMGLPEATLLGRTNEELGLPAASAQMSREQDDTVLRTGQAHLFEHPAVFMGAAHTLLTSKFPIIAADGTLSGVGGFALDITQHKELEQQYLQAQKMEGIGRLAGGIAHDFNNLLSIILGYAEMVAIELESDHPAMPSVQHIEAAATRAAGLTRQLLAFARRQVADRKVLDLAEHLDAMKPLLRPLVPENIRLDIPGADAPGYVRVDVGQIEQVVVNLVVNARDAMPMGGTLRLETGTITFQDDTWHGIPVVPGRYVCLAVTDTGAGMSREVQSHLFEPFFTTKGVGKGTGLGLATCYGIVKQHRGYIRVHSEPGAGTTVQVCLPGIDADADVSEAPATVAAATRGTETVLVVEDEEMLRQLAVRVLRTHGYTVLEAADGDAALQLASACEQPIDLLLSDMVMPNMGGAELAYWLRELHPEARVLFMSGYNEESEEFGHRIAEPIPLIRKPYTTRELLGRIRDVLAA